ncbi:MAG: hypothetical protein LBV49_04105 [Azonexus sp.]|jgi:hypothetical protein|nr:hypothetical protein [Azonexus sp.]
MNGRIWTPSRQSNAVRAFMAVLRMDSPLWDWADSPALASWWVIDSACGIDVTALTSYYDQMPGKPEVAFLAAQPGSLPHPAWTLFKPPVKSSLIFDWIKQRQPAGPPPVDRPTPSFAPAMPWRHGLLRLKRWPNPARYDNSLEFTVACSRLLGAPATYAQILEWGIAAPLLDRILQDALAEGLLDISDPSPAAAAIRPEKDAAAATDADTSRWGLIKRLLGKFSLK